MNNFCDRFEKIINLIKTIRKLKSEEKIGSKIIDNVHIYLQRDEIYLGMILESKQNICRLAKTKSLLIVYFDEVNIDNGIIMYYNYENDTTYVSTVIPNIAYDELAIQKEREKLFDLIQINNFVLL